MKRIKKYFVMFLMLNIILYITKSYYIDMKLDEKEWVLLQLVCSALLLPILIIFSKMTLRGIENLNYRLGGMAAVDVMTGEEFEQFLYKKLKKRGYKITLTPKTADYGADLIMKDKRGKIIIVQAKRYKTKISIKAVQEVVSAKEYYNADKAIVITNNYFTKNAKELAEKTNTELWDRDILIRNIL